jgi:sugar-specific transcriptional regulator TrmB
MLEILMKLGLTETEAYVYLYITRKGPKRARVIGEALSLYKQRLYWVLRKMQRKGFIKASGYPALFSAVPLEKVVDLLIKANMEQAEYVMQNRKELLSGWYSMIKKDLNDS